jgi:hypothetical protein
MHPLARLMSTAVGRAPGREEDPFMDSTSGRDGVVQPVFGLGAHGRPRSETMESVDEVFRKRQRLDYAQRQCEELELSTSSRKDVLESSQVSTLCGEHDILLTSEVIVVAATNDDQDAGHTCCRS